MASTAEEVPVGLLLWRCRADEARWSRRCQSFRRIRGFLERKRTKWVFDFIASCGCLFFYPPSTTISAHFEEKDTACAYRDYRITVKGCPT